MKGTCRNSAAFTERGAGSPGLEHDAEPVRT
jgi:hypothetical protein